MPKVHRHALVMYSAKQMYDLVNDVAAYPQFVPDCMAVDVISKTSTELKASVQIGKASIGKWFTTHNKMQDGQSVEINLIDGPFKKLVGLWQFIPLDDEACKVVLDLDFEFSSKIIEVAFGSIFNHMANNMVKAFTQRAKEVYA
ncbi:type II toxin-antitoxin system RatA family toxin [Catenovulum sp. 2E275]|uniref:type II toxin-antitoxin system RatA family toxin n=1 Tax=Catenovulum sp. 2E275 TaxID=2980497 RepID=UPI0021D173CB|nr:type II toxin-antitoxin system RatA family toxin [Catenovulum sp. 2E275]MCU4676728.1 type II toxin-antitoxin system RatA family toxin [Catenovulum sp. 2E275]